MGDFRSDSNWSCYKLTTTDQSVTIKVGPGATPAILLGRPASLIGESGPKPRYRQVLSFPCVCFPHRLPSVLFRLLGAEG